MAEVEPGWEGSASAGAPGSGANAQNGEARAEAKRILRTTPAGALATLDPAAGAPFATLVSVATDFDGSPILLTSALSAHSRNMAADPRVSLLLAVRGKGDPLAHPRLTLSGRAERVSTQARKNFRTRFLARHPKAALYADFADFAFWRVDVAGGHFNGGFARAAEFARSDLILEAESAKSLRDAETGALAHLNSDHTEALEAYARVFANEAGGRWRAVALDPEGLDLSASGREVRIDFPRRADTPDDLRQILVELARIAKSSAPSS